MANPLTEGRLAAAKGLCPADCPYAAKDDRARSWQRGYERGARELGLCPWCGGDPAAGHVCDIRDAVTSRGTSAKIRQPNLRICARGAHDGENF